MNETLKEISKKNIFVRIAVNAISKKTKNLGGMSELVALYYAMGWINADECSEVMAYATEQLTEEV